MCVCVKFVPFFFNNIFEDLVTPEVCVEIFLVRFNNIFKHVVPKGVTTHLV